MKSNINEDLCLIFFGLFFLIGNLIFLSYFYNMKKKYEENHAVN